MRNLLFQVVREWLFNVVKYAGTSQAAIELLSLPAFQDEALESEALMQEAREREALGDLLPGEDRVSFEVAEEESANEESANEESAREEESAERPVCIIRVTDDGTGFDPEATGQEREGGFGLSNGRERIGLMGGALVIDSAPGTGTRVTVIAPVRSEAVL